MVAGPAPDSAVTLSLPGLTALGYYRGDLARAVRAYKFRGARRLAPLFALPLAAAVSSRGWRPQLVTHVPLHSSRKRRRGFDQAQELAAAIASRLRLPTQALLERTHPTPPQARLSAVERRHNVRSAFRARGMAPDWVLLVDDVFTTGATLAACRLALECAGAQRVTLAVLAVAARKTPAGRW